MNKNPLRQYRLSALATSLICTFGHAYADTQDERMAEVLPLIMPDSNFSVGIGNWSNDRHQQGVYDGMRDGKAYGFLDLDLVKRYEDTGTWLTLTGRNLGLDTRELRAEWLRQGDIGVSIEYSRLTRDNPLTYITGLQGIGTATQVISGAGALPKSEVSLGTTRDLTQLGFYKSFSRSTELKVTFSNEEKNGARHWGLGSNAYFLTEPIDSTTRQFEAILNYSSERLQLSGGYYASWYNNANSIMSGTISGGAKTSLSLPFDNQAHQLFFNGGYALTPKTRATFKLAYAKATQDEALPHASDWGVRAATAPASLRGRVDTTTAEVGLISRPLQKLSLVANLRYHDVQDKTPVALYTAIGNGYHTPHSYTTKSGKLEGTYRLPEGFSLTAGVDYKDQDRTAPTVGDLAAVTNVRVPFRLSIEETSYRMQLRRGLSETINGSLAFLRTNRDGSGDVPTTNAGAYRAINPMHIADRTRDKWRGMIDWSPTAKLSFQFAAEDSRDDYAFRPAVGVAAADEPQGLKDGSAKLYSIDATYTIDEFWQATAYYSIDVTKANLLGRGATVANQKTTNLEEKGDSFGVGLKGQFSSKFKFGTNLDWMKSVTKQNQIVPAGEIVANYSLFPGEITNKLIRFNLFAEYAVAKSSDLRIDLIHERWRTDDWTWMFADGSPFVYNGTTASIDGTTVMSKPKANATFIGARYIYKFQ